MKNKLIIGIVIVVVIVLAFLLAKPTKPGVYDTFAQCLKDSGTIFYGAFWCPHCRDQKAMFGKSASVLPYVECSTPDGNSMVPLCQEKGVKAFPTWVFPNGEKSEGTLTLQTLSEKTNCPLPQ